MSTMHDTPLFDVLRTRADVGAHRFHMPGHKGRDPMESPLAGAMRLDFTELYGTGNLYDGTYPIADAEVFAAHAWRVPQAFFLTGGATQGLLSALLFLRRRTDTILIDRACHKSVYHGLGLSDYTPRYLTPVLEEPFGIAGPLSPARLDAALTETPAGAVVITSPTYYGVCSDIRALADVAHAHGAYLLVDEAHGAHLPFHTGFDSAVAQGADLAVCSLHKTLPALGQAALLTAREGLDPSELRQCTSIYGTSSPSYAVMAGMDLTRAFMETSGCARSDELAARVQTLRDAINAHGIFRAYPSNDPLRLCVYTAGLCGFDAARLLEERDHVVCEMADTRNVLFIITAADTDADLDALAEALFRLETDAEGSAAPTPVALTLPRVQCSPRTALLAGQTRVPLADAVGCVLAQTLCPYPPGIPVVAPGEVLDASHLTYLYENGFSPEDPVSIINDLGGGYFYETGHGNCQRG